jgi:hypothetical protein
MNRAVNICRKLGLSAPHPIRIKVVIAARRGSIGANQRKIRGHKETVYSVAEEITPVCADYLGERRGFEPIAISVR